MKSISRNVPILLLILFEAIVGVALIARPEDFSRTVIICFGIVMLLIGIFHLIRFFRLRGSGAGGGLTLTVAVITLIIGILCTFCTSVIFGMFSVVAVIYGVVMLVSGIYKLQSWLDLKKVIVNPPLLPLVSAIATILFGVIVAFNPFQTLVALLRFTGAVLLCEGVLDLLGLLMRGRSRH